MNVFANSRFPVRCISNGHVVRRSIEAVSSRRELDTSWRWVVWELWRNVTQEALLYLLVERCRLTIHEWKQRDFRGIYLLLGALSRFCVALEVRHVERSRCHLSFGHCFVAISISVLLSEVTIIFVSLTQFFILKIQFKCIALQDWFVRLKNRCVFNWLIEFWGLSRACSSLCICLYFNILQQLQLRVALAKFKPFESLSGLRRRLTVLSK